MNEERPATRTNFAGAFLQGLSLFLKFALVLYITRFLPLSDLGIYGLFSATNTLTIYLLGLEYFHYAQREVLARPAEERPAIVWSQARVQILTFCLTIPCVIVVSATGILPFSVAIWLFPIVLTTHLCQEAFRYLVILGYSQRAYLTSAVANALWIPLVIAGGLSSPELRNLHFIFGTWAVFSAITAIAAWLLLGRLGLLKGGPGAGGWRHVKEGLGVCWMYLLMSLSAKLIDLSDRYFIKAFWNDEDVAVYAFFSRITVTAHDLLYAGIFAVLYPQLISAYQSRDRDAWQRIQQKFRRALQLALGVIFPLYAVGIFPLLWFAGEPKLNDHISIYYILLVSSAVYNLSMVSHFTLYAMRKDRGLLAIELGGVALNLALQFVLVPRYSGLGAAIALSVTIVVLALTKLIASNVFLKQDNWSRENGEK